MNKKEYHDWFDKYLGDVETDFQTNLQSPLLHAPKPFKLWRWLIVLITLTVISLMGSFLIDVFTNLKWISNVLANIGAGLIASIIILLFSTSKEKNIEYMSEAIPLLRERLKNMHEAYYYDMARQTIASQQGDYITYFDCAHRWTNTYTVILEFYKLLCETAKYKPKYLTECFSDIENGHEKCRVYLDEVYDNYNTKNEKNDLNALANKQLKIGCLTDVILNIIGMYTDDLESKLLKIKFNKQNKTKEMKENEIKMKKFRKNY